MTKNELIQNCFKQIDNTNYFVNIKGDVYNLKRQSFLKKFKSKGRGVVCLNFKTVSIAKLILDCFTNYEPRTKYVNFKDNNKENLNIENLEYCTLSKLQKNKKHSYKRLPIKTSPHKLASYYKHYIDYNEESLTSLLSNRDIRKDFENEILTKRGDTKEYVLNKLLLIEYNEGMKIENISKQYGIAITKVQKMIHKGREQLLNEIEIDIANELITPKPQTPPQTLKQLKNEILSRLKAKKLDK